MGLRDKLRRLERASREETIDSPQQDGTVRRFPKSAYKEAFLNTTDRLGAGEDAPPRHPVLEAAANSSDPRWRTSFFSDIDFVDGAVETIEDLSDSEGAW